MLAWLGLIKKTIHYQVALPVLYIPPIFYDEICRIIVSDRSPHVIMDCNDIINYNVMKWNCRVIPISLQGLGHVYFLGEGGGGVV